MRNETEDVIIEPALMRRMKMESTLNKAVV
jgi:hypothetical protein